MIYTDDELEEAVEEKRSTMNRDRLTMSLGEIIHLYEDGDLIITPEYQRAYRWTAEQKTDFIESILLGIPVPPIFVAEDRDRKWELVDGLQRISTILSFFGELKNNPQNNLVLVEGSIIKKLKGHNKKSIPLKLRNTIKRAFCRVEILMWDDIMNMRYELYNRLNATGSLLTPQEIRNCIFNSNNKLNQLNFNPLLKDLVKLDKFEKVVVLSEREKIEMYGEELVLRFFCFQHDYEIKESLQRHLNQFMRDVTQKDISFNIPSNRDRFIKILGFLKADDFRGGGELNLANWDGILYYVNGRIDSSKDPERRDIEEIKKELQDTDISKRHSHKDRPKKAIEVAKKFL